MGRPTDMAPELTATRLRELLSYNKETGQFTRLVRAGHCHPGDLAGSIKKSGYVQISVDARDYWAHRLAFLWVNGEWPSDQVDHIDTNPSNNAWLNLRGVNQSVNLQNRRSAQANNASGFLGVTLIPGRVRARYMAQITTAGKKKCLGYFATADAAHAAYIAAKRLLHEGCTI